MTTWFTADNHFGHTNIIGYSSRPFKYIDDMNETLIKNWNECVKDDDHIYFLGDFSLSNPDRSEAIVCRLNGKKHWILGNHDHKPVIKRIEQYFEWVKDVYLLTVQDQELPYKKALIWLSHYAHFIWPQKHYGSWHLFAHSHGKLLTDVKTLAIDVGVDCWDYKPISYEQVKNIMMNEKEYKQYYE